MIFISGTKAPAPVGKLMFIINLTLPYLSLKKKLNIYNTQTNLVTMILNCVRKEPLIKVQQMFFSQIR